MFILKLDTDSQRVLKRIMKHNHFGNARVQYSMNISWRLNIGLSSDTNHAIVPFAQFRVFEYDITALFHTDTRWLIHERKVVHTRRCNTNVTFLTMRLQRKTFVVVVANANMSVEMQINVFVKRVLHANRLRANTANCAHHILQLNRGRLLANQFELVPKLSTPVVAKRDGTSHLTRNQRRVMQFVHSCTLLRLQFKHVVAKQSVALNINRKRHCFIQRIRETNLDTDHLSQICANLNHFLGIRRTTHKLHCKPLETLLVRTLFHKRHAAMQSSTTLGCDAQLIASTFLLRLNTELIVAAYARQVRFNGIHHTRPRIVRIGHFQHMLHTRFRFALQTHMIYCQWLATMTVQVIHVRFVRGVIIQRELRSRCLLTRPFWCIYELIKTSLFCRHHKLVVGGCSCAADIEIRGCVSTEFGGNLPFAITVIHHRNSLRHSLHRMTLKLQLGARSLRLHQHFHVINPNISQVEHAIRTVDKCRLKLDAARVTAIRLFRIKCDPESVVFVRVIIVHNQLFGSHKKVRRNLDTVHDRIRLQRNFINIVHHFLSQVWILLSTAFGGHSSRFQQHWIEKRRLEINVMRNAIRIFTLEFNVFNRRWQLRFTANMIQKFAIFAVYKRETRHLCPHHKWQIFHTQRHRLSRFNFDTPSIAVPRRRNTRLVIRDHWWPCAVVVVMLVRYILDNNLKLAVRIKRIDHLYRHFSALVQFPSALYNCRRLRFNVYRFQLKRQCVWHFARKFRIWRRLRQQCQSRIRCTHKPRRIRNENISFRFQGYILYQL
mmetsp:Transcript_27104/g.44532  ORF Transcript_27104/g.44532 Transcript_27104/m.44532 type:complete len:775 (-) Transcript_27104:651-2975(-)